jgi:hypothetical protein
MAGIKEMTFKRLILGIPVTITETKDGVQRFQIIKDASDTVIGSISTDKWTKQVRAIPANKADTKIINVGLTYQSKDQAFVELRRWLIAHTYKLPEMVG